MKILKTLTMLLLCISISCTSDEDDILGTWNLMSLDLDCATEPDLSQSVNASNGCITMENEQTCISMTFKENGSGLLDFTINGRGETSGFSYSQNVSNTEIEICNQDDVDECSTLVIRGDELLIIDNVEGCDAEYSFIKQ